MAEWTRKQQLLELGRTVVSAARTRRFLSSDELYEQRVSICTQCDKCGPKASDPDVLACGVCGCRIDHKAMVPTSKCPLGKW